MAIQNYLRPEVYQAWQQQGLLGSAGRLVYDGIMERWRQSGMGTQRPSLEQWAQWAMDVGLTPEAAQRLAMEWYTHASQGGVTTPQAAIQFFDSFLNRAPAQAPSAPGQTPPPSGTPVDTSTPPPPTGTPGQPGGGSGMALYDYLVARHQASGLGNQRPSIEQWAQWAYEWGQQTGALTYTQARQLAEAWYRFRDMFPNEGGRESFGRFYDAYLNPQVPPGTGQPTPPPAEAQPVPPGQTPPPEIPATAQQIGLWDYLQQQIQRTGNTQPSLEQWAQWAADWGAQTGQLSWGKARSLAQQWYDYLAANPNRNTQADFDRFFQAFLQPSDSGIDSLLSYSQWTQLDDDTKQRYIQQALERIRTFSNPYNPAVKALSPDEYEQLMRAADRVIAYRDAERIDSTGYDWDDNPTQSALRTQWTRWYSPAWQGLRGQTTPSMNAFEAAMRSPYAYQDPSRSEAPPVVQGRHMSYWAWQHLSPELQEAWKGDWNQQGLDPDSQLKEFETFLPTRGRQRMGMTRRTGFGF